MLAYPVTQNKEDSSASQRRCEVILCDEYRCSTFNILNVNEAKKTFCYLMQYHINIVSAYCCMNGQIDQSIINKIYAFYAVQHFVKILEDQAAPIEFAKKLMQNTYYQNTLQNDLIIPQFAGDTTDRSAAHKYDIVQYSFVPHMTLQSIAIRMIQTKQLDPKYFLNNLKGSNSKNTAWRSQQYKLQMLYIFERVIRIVIKLHQLQLIDLDISADNFIIKTVKNGSAQWKEIIAQNCVKIDHESVLEFKNGSLFAYEMNKPMKVHCQPPEISADVILNEPNKIIQVEPFSVYQIAATFIMILFGQVHINGIWYTLGIDNDKVTHETLEWNPKFDLFPDDLTFLSDCLSISPSKRPSFRNLLKYVFRSIEVTNHLIEKINNINALLKGNNLPKKVIRKKNSFYGNNNNGRVGIIHNRQRSTTNNGEYNNIQQRHFGRGYERCGRFEIIRNGTQFNHIQQNNRQQLMYQQRNRDHLNENINSQEQYRYNMYRFCNNNRQAPPRNNFQ